MGIKTELKRIFFSAAALYLADDFVDVAKGSQTPGGLKLVSFQRIPLVKKVKESAYLEAADELDRALAGAFSENEPPPYRIAVNLKNDSVVLRHFTLKGIRPKDVSRAIVFEAQKYIPYSIDDVAYHFRTYGHSSNAVEVAFAGAEKRAIDAPTAYFAAKGILASTIESNPALINKALLLGKHLKTMSAYLSVHFEPANKVIITGIHHRHPYFFREVRVLPEGDEQTTGKIRYLTLKEAWPHIEQHLISSIAFFRKDINQTVEKIFITGFAPAPDEFDTVKDFGTPFERPGISFAGDTPDARFDSHLPTLALLHDSVNLPSSNLASDETAKKDFRVLRQVALRSALMFAAIFIAHFAFIYAGSFPNKKIAALSQIISAYPGMSSTSTAADVTKYMDTLREKAKVAHSIFVLRPRLTDKLNRIGSDMPSNAWMSAVSYQDALSDTPNRALRLKGAIYAGGEKGVSSAHDIVQNLTNDKVLMEGFKTVSLLSVDKATMLDKEITNFEISIN